MIAHVCETSEPNCGWTPCVVALERALRNVGPPVRWKEGQTVPAVLRAIEKMGLIVVDKDQVALDKEKRYLAGFDAGFRQGYDDGIEDATGGTA